MTEDANGRLVAALDKISKVLGALYASHLGDIDQGLKATRLSRCGFSNSEIADLLGTSANTINVALHKARRKRNPKKKNK